MVRVADREGLLGQVAKYPAIGLGFTLAFFVLYDAPLLIELGLVDGADEVTHTVRLHPQRHIQCRSGDIFKVVGTVVIGGAVHVCGTGFFEGAEVFVVVVFGAVEHQVFKQVGKAGFTGFFIFGADGIPNVNGYDGSFVIFMHHHFQAIAEGETGVGNINLRQCLVTDGGTGAGAGRSGGLTTTEQRCRDGSGRQGSKKAHLVLSFVGVTTGRYRKCTLQLNIKTANKCNKW